MRQTYEVCDADGVQVGGVSRVLQVGQRRAERVVNALPAVVVPLHVQQVGDHVNGCGDTERRLVTAAVRFPQHTGAFSFMHVGF